MSATADSTAIPDYWCPCCTKPISGDARFCDGCGADLMNPFAARADPVSGNYADSWIASTPELASSSQPVDLSVPHHLADRWSPSQVGRPREEAQMPWASFGQRLGAHLIDQAAILAAAWFVGRPFGAMLGGFVYASGSPIAWEMMSLLGGLLVAAFTSFVFEVFWVGSHLQATPGKRVLRLKVTDLRGQPVGFGRAFGRYVMKGLSGSALCIGFLMQPFTAKKQALHDLLIGTLVLRA